MPTLRRPARLALLVVLIVAGVAMIGYLVNRDSDTLRVSPLDIEWVGDSGFATVAEGQILHLTIDGAAVRGEVVAEGLQSPRGLAVIGDTLYVAELGELPCESPFPRCKGEQIGPTIADGERQILAESAGRITAYPMTANGLGEPEVLVDGLSFVNSDHGLNDLEVGPDDHLYLAIGNLDELAWNDGGSPPNGPETELLGSVLRIDPSSGTIEVFANGFRNVYGLAFDEAEVLWGVDNDGRGRSESWRFEELERIEDGLDFGFPDDGTVGPYTRRTGFATWILPSGAGSGGLEVRDGTVISGGCGSVTRLRLQPDGGDADLRTVDRRGCVTAIVALPDGRLLLGTVLGGEPFTVTSESALFDD